MLDAFTKKRIGKILDNYIDKKIPNHLKNEIEIRYKFRGNTVTLSQEKPGYMGGRFEYPIAQLRLDESYWKVYWKDSKDKWHFVDDIEPVTDFEKQLMEIDSNDIFWV
ncbi:DUF3024 domain-containing protein [Cohnella sp. JJ-181]|uniref:DUF3024 domain-containing protein n=1 Tax=Cohnella rhizoplanae TaxID=2974897 RepID=UPI0022FF7FC1|nr:DUF3024 domain-containing protein [Cohnella sp. JJ-181]CAI6087334.1 hypothetical protein COHCIP112018_05456 [Cohnella sp. JJ-181]